jgi:hypothetical protein
MKAGLKSWTGFKLVNDWYFTLCILLFFYYETSLFEVSSAEWMSDQSDC